MNDLIEQREIGDYRITIYPDYDARCPVTEWDMAGCHLFETYDMYHQRLCSECDWKELFPWGKPFEHTLEEAIRRLISDVIGQKGIIKYLKAEKVSNTRFVYNRTQRQWEMQTRWTVRGQLCDWTTQWSISSYDLNYYDNSEELLEYFDKDDMLKLLEEGAKDYVFKEWASSGYCQGDYLYGLSYMSKEQYEKRVGKAGRDWQKHAYKLISGEVKEISKWAWGDVLGFVLEKKVYFTKEYADEDRDPEDCFEWEEIDSCWGYYLDTEELIAEVISEHNIKEAVEA